MSSSSDRRRSGRAPLDRFIVCLRVGDIDVSGNLSSGGVGFELPAPLIVGEPVCVSMIIPGTLEPVSASAMVRHCTRIESRRWAIGAAFLAVDSLVQWPIDRYVDERCLELLLDSTRGANG